MRSFQKRRERLFLIDPVVGAEEGEVVERCRECASGSLDRCADGDSNDDGGVDRTLLMLQTASWGVDGVKRMETPHEAKQGYMSLHAQH